MGTTVNYNGVVLTNVTTRQWDQTMVYDNSHTDLLYSKFRMTFEGVLHGENKTLHGIYPVESLAVPNVITYRQISRRLQEPRKSLYVWMSPDNTTDHSTLFFQVHPYNLSDLTHRPFDVETGPKPSEVKITHIASNKLFRVQFTIECAKVDCLDGYGNVTYQNGVVLNNRWRIEEDMDGNFFTTRTVSGTLRLATATHIGHAYKFMVVPPLEMGFKREAIQYTVSENGLDCNYTVKDRQVHTAAPWPATGISGTHTESTNDGITFHADMSVRLEGSPEADKADLLQRCVQIVDSRLHLIEHRNQVSPKYWIEYAAIIDHIGPENVVEMQVKIMRVPPGDAAGATDVDLGEFLTNVVAESFGRPLELPPLHGEDNYDVRVSRLPSLYGYDPQTGLRDPTAALYLLHCYMQTPCGALGTHMMNQAGKVEPGEKDPGRTTVTGSTAYKPVEKNDTPNQYSDDTYEAVYTYYELQNTYGIQVIRVQAPYATKAGPFDETSKVFLLSGGRAFREIKLEAERAGAWPQIPPPMDEYTDGTIKAWLIDHKEFTQPPKMTADGRHKLYKIEATYRWALNRFPQPGEATHTGVLAFTKYTQDENALKRDNIYLARLNP